MTMFLSCYIGSVNNTKDATIKALIATYFLFVLTKINKILPGKLSECVHCPLVHCVHICVHTPLLHTKVHDPPCSPFPMCKGKPGGPPCSPSIGRRGGNSGNGASTNPWLDWNNWKHKNIWISYGSVLKLILTWNTYVFYLDY